MILLVKGSLIGPSMVNLFPNLSFAKPLEYIPKASPQSVLPYLGTDLFLRLNTKVHQLKNSLFVHTG